MSKFYAVYESRDGIYPVGIFKTKKAASDFVGSSTGFYETRIYQHLTRYQIETLEVVSAIEFDMRLDYAITHKRIRKNGE
jgi:hypothetical protein